jgi:tetratricopeptide (TPR) repeat protein
MTNEPLSEIEALSPSVAQDLDEACLRFEAALKAATPSGPWPRLEDYLDDLPEPGRSVLRGELQALQDIYVPAEQTTSEYGPGFDFATPMPEPAKEAPPPNGRGVPTTRITTPGPSPEPAGPATTTAVPGQTTLPTIPGYVVLSELGRGGMGVVYKAEQVGLKRLVALKMVLAGAHAAPEQLTRFRREAEAIAQLRHPNIVQVYEVGEHEGQPFYVLEFLDGGSLDKKLAGDPQPAVPAARLLETLARAVHAAHQKGIVHRDLKPANILLDIADCQAPLADSRSAVGDRKSAIESLQSAIPKISDFGLAKQVDDDAVNTISGAILGTPRYMAPEQAFGRVKEVGPPADIHALGVILYELLTGRPPFRGANQLETLEQVRYQEPVPPRRLQPRLPRDVDTICLKCLEKAPHRRYASALDLAEDLRRFQAGEPIRARPAGGLERLAKWVRRRPAIATLVIVFAFLILGAVAGTAYLAVSRSRQAAQQLEARRTVSKQIDQARREMAEGRLDDANATLSGAEPGIGPEPEWDDLRAEWDALHRQVKSLRQLQADRRKAADLYGTFLRLRDQAVFHATLSVGEGVATNLQAARTRAGEALAVFGVVVDPPAGPVLPSALTDAEKREVGEDCYWLLLVLAEVHVTAGSGQKDAAQEALHLLDRAAELGIESRAYHQRRARYLRLLGDDARAQADHEDQTAQAIRPTTALDYYLLGDEEYKRGRVPEAARNFVNALALQSNHFWARYFLAVCDLRENHPSEARSELINCLSQNRDFIWLHVMLGYANGKLGDFPAAEANFAEALEKKPTPEERYAIFANRGVLYVRAKKWPEAIADLKQAIALRPDRHEAYLSLAQVYQSQGDLPSALERFNPGGWWSTILVKVVRGYLPSALEQFNCAIKADPAAAAYRGRARYYLERNDLDAALRDFEQAIRAEPTGSRSHDLARDHVGRGVIYNRQKKYTEAEKAFAEAVKVWSGCTAAYLGQAEARVGLKQYDQAVAALDAYLRNHGKPSAQVYRLRGQALAQRREHYPEAIAAYTVAIEKDPKDDGLRVLRGWLYVACDDTRLALDDFQKAIEFNPGNGDAHNGRGLVRARLGQLREAVADAEEAVRLAPRVAQVAYDAVRIYALVADAQEAQPLPLTGRPARAAGVPGAREYRRRARELLAKALAALPRPEREPFWQAHVLRDTALAPLRRAGDVAQVEAEYFRREGMNLVPR